jgi:hypothetical protein
MNVLDIARIALTKVAALFVIVAAITKLHRQVMMMND